MMKILITGGSGFLGTALTQSLKTHGVKGDTASVTWVSRSVEKEKTKNIADDVISYDDLASTDQTGKVAADCKDGMCKTRGK